MFLSFHCNQQFGFRVDANMISFISKWSVHDLVDLCSGSIQYVSICSATGRKTNISSSRFKFDNMKDDGDELLDSSKSTRSTARKPSDSPNSRKGVRSFGGPSSSLVWTMDSKPLNTAFCKSCNKLLRWSSGPICFCSTYSWHMSRSIPPSLCSKKWGHCGIKWKKARVTQTTIEGRKLTPKDHWFRQCESWNGISVAGWTCWVKAARRKSDILHRCQSTE